MSLRRSRNYRKPTDTMKKALFTLVTVNNDWSSGAQWSKHRHVRVMDYKWMLDARRRQAQSMKWNRECLCSRPRIQRF